MDTLNDHTTPIIHMLKIYMVGTIEEKENRMLVTLEYEYPSLEEIQNICHIVFPANLSRILLA